MDATHESLNSLESYSLEERQTISEKLSRLSIIAKFIGKDFYIPVELNEPGKGWYWDFKEKVIRVDPKDLLEKPIEYLRFVIAHEGGHRRISRTGFIPLETWNQPGFSFLMNAIEDPRDNNFVAENYPAFAEQLPVGYEWLQELNGKIDKQARNKLGYIPRFKRAGFEYIKQWFREYQKHPQEFSSDLPSDVRGVIEKTVTSASEAWWMYPSKAQADSGEKQINRFAEASYDTILENIWPEYQKLVELDKEDQKLEEFLKEMQKERQDSKDKSDTEKEKGKEDDGSGEKGVGKTEELTAEEQKALEDALDGKGDGENIGVDEGEKQDAGGKAVPLDSIPESLKEKLRKKISELSDEKRQELAKKAEKAMKDFEKELAEQVGGKLTETPEQKAEREIEEQKAKGEQEKEAETKKDSGVSGKDGEKPKDEVEKETRESKQRREKEIGELRKKLEKISDRDADVYEKTRREASPTINELTNDLRNIFRERRASRYEGGHRTGPRISIARRIVEIAKGISPFESRAWERKVGPFEKDYAISLLVDLSGSMQGQKIEETFKAVIVIAEALNNNHVNIEVIGFNDRVYEFEKFKEKLTDDVRGRMGTMLEEVRSSRARWNDDGWAVGEASARLAKCEATEKILIVLSDGKPEPSGVHSGDEYDLKSVVDKIVATGTQKIIGLGIGGGTSHVKHFYPKSVAEVSASEMAPELAKLLRELIAEGGKSGKIK